MTVALSHPMRSVTRTYEWFLNDPRCRKWIVQCSGCERYGRKPETPATIPKFRFEEMFPILTLDEQGKCSECQGAGHVA